VFNVFALVVPSLGVAARPHQASNAFLYHQVVDSFVGFAKENTYIVLGKKQGLQWKSSGQHAGHYFGHSRHAIEASKKFAITSIKGVFGSVS
jgi:hypothetical protein